MLNGKNALQFAGAYGHKLKRMKLSKNDTVKRIGLLVGVSKN